MRALVLVVLLLATAFGCTTTINRDFHPDDFKMSQGTSSISGVAFLTYSSGEFRPAREAPVVLYPKNPYSRQWFEKEVKGGMTIQNLDYRFDSMAVRTNTDSQGRFQFEGLPAGEYYIASPMLRDTTNAVTNTVSRTGYVYAEVTLSPGQKIKDLELTR